MPRSSCFGCPCILILERVYRGLCRSIIAISFYTQAIVNHRVVCTITQTRPRLVDRLDDEHVLALAQHIFHGGKVRKTQIPRRVLFGHGVGVILGRPVSRVCKLSLHGGGRVEVGKLAHPKGRPDIFRLDGVLAQDPVLFGHILGVVLYDGPAVDIGIEIAVVVRVSGGWAFAHRRGGVVAGVQARSGIKRLGLGGDAAVEGVVQLVGQRVVLPRLFVGGGTLQGVVRVLPNLIRIVTAVGELPVQRVHPVYIVLVGLKGGQIRRGRDLVAGAKIRVDQCFFDVFVHRRAGIAFRVDHQRADETVVPVIEENLRAADAAGGLAVGLRVHQRQAQALFFQRQQVLEEGVLRVGLRVAVGGPVRGTVGQCNRARGLGGKKLLIPHLLLCRIVDRIGARRRLVGGDLPARVQIRAQIVVEFRELLSRAVGDRVLGVPHALVDGGLRRLCVRGFVHRCCAGIPPAQIGQRGLAHIRTCAVIYVQIQPKITGIGHIQMGKTLHIVGKAHHHHGSGGLVDHSGVVGGIGAEGEERIVALHLFDQRGGVVDLVGLGGVQTDGRRAGAVDQRLQFLHILEDLGLIGVIHVNAPGIICIKCVIAARRAGGAAGRPIGIDRLARTPRHRREGVQVDMYRRRRGLEGVVGHLIFRIQLRAVALFQCLRQLFGIVLLRDGRFGGIVLQRDRAGRANAQSKLIKAGGLPLVHDHVALNHNLGFGRRRVSNHIRAVYRCRVCDAGQQRASQRRRQGKGP